MYKIEYWRKKKIQLSVKGGELRVYAPYGTNDDVIGAVVQKHKRWIKNHLEYARKKDEIENALTDDEILKLNKKALAVAIYDIKTGKEIKRQYQKNIKPLEDYVKFREELMYDYGVENFLDGYRLVYFYPNSEYSVGAFCKSIEGFMFE